MINLFLIREDTEILCNHYTAINKLRLLKLNSIYLHTESYQEIQKVQKNLISLKRGIK